MNLVIFLLGLLLGLLVVRWWFGQPRWRVKVANGHLTQRFPYFTARRLAGQWPGGLAEVVRDA